MTTNQIEILLVEDKRSDAEMTIRALRKNNLINEIIHVTDGEKALDFLFARGEYKDRDITQKPRVILLDVKMPKLNGIEVLRILKEHEQTKKIPVVMLTSSSEDPDIEESYLLGANSYIVKPVAFQDFITTVSDLGMYWVILNKIPSK